MSWGLGCWHSSRRCWRSSRAAACAAVSARSSESNRKLSPARSRKRRAIDVAFFELTTLYLKARDVLTQDRKTVDQVVLARGAHESVQQHHFHHC